jgi:hypothetical protein
MSLSISKGDFDQRSAEVNSKIVTLALPSRSPRKARIAIPKITTVGQSAFPSCRHEIHLDWHSSGHARISWTVADRFTTHDARRFDRLMYATQLKDPEFRQPKDRIKKITRSAQSMKHIQVKEAAI